MKIRLLIVCIGLSLITFGCATTMAITKQNITSCVIAKEITDKNAPKDICDPCLLEGNICLYVSFHWDDIEQDAGYHEIETKWYRENKLVYQKKEGFNFGKQPAWYWNCLPAATIGTGKNRVDLFIDGKMITSKNYTIVEKLPDNK